MESQLEALDVVEAKRIYERSVQQIAVELKQQVTEEICPIDAKHVVSNEMLLSDKDCYERKGYQMIRAGKVAVVTLGGGQGTRLGFSGPKGKYDFGLLTQKTLFQLQAERLLKVMELASSSEDSAAAGTQKVTPWYIMTSPLNHEETVQYFADHEYFGLSSDHVSFFQQGVLPCFDLSSDKILFKTDSELATSPDGNGGVYASLAKSKCLEDMVKRGVEYVQFCSVDNALVVPADPLFIGAALVTSPALEVANLTCKKKSWDEKVGVFALRNNELSVIEYSEISESMAKSLDSKNELIFRSANTCNHLLSVQFLISKVFSGDLQRAMVDMPYHVAKKKIPFYDLETEASVSADSLVSVNGIKLELFIFDVFKRCDLDKFVNVELDRAKSFSPVKNAPGTPKDSPDSARRMARQLCCSWLQQIGCPGFEQVDEACVVEISPSVSLRGEGLGNLVQQATLTAPLVLAKESEISHLKAMKTSEDVKALNDKLHVFTANDGIRVYFIR